jgi:hypothetical protein
VDEFDVGQVFDLDPAANSVVENAAIGTAVGITGFGIDLDSTNNSITYSLTESAGGRFAIHPSTGVVSVANGSLLDREAASARMVRGAARSSGSRCWMLKTDDELCVARAVTGRATGFRCPGRVRSSLRVVP